MQRTTLLTSLASLMVFGLPFIAHGADDSTKIGISVVIGETQQCDYGYSVEDSRTSNSNYFQSSTCDSGNSGLQQHLDKVAYSTSKVEETRYRVLMTVQ